MKLVAVIAASLIGVSALAQSAAVETESVTAGLIGKRYVAAGFGWSDLNHTSTDGYAAGLDVNLPVHTNFDVSLGYSYGWFDGGFELGHSVGAAVTGYITRGENKPYATLSTGYIWGDAGNGFGDYGVWGVEVGVERSLNEKIAATLSVGYDDDFGQNRDSGWDVSVGATYNITDKLVGQAEASYIEYGTMGYSIGLAYRF